jgi:hypothetical protein
MGLLVESFIDTELWDQAKLKGVIYIPHPAGKTAPLLGLLFRDIQKGVEIFKRWQDRLGEEDSFEELRISIVEGDIPGQEAGYSVVIGSNPEATIERRKSEGRDVDFDQMFTTSRIRRINPAPGSQHLAMFKELFAQFGGYLLLPMPMEITNAPENDVPMIIRENLPYGITKHTISFKRAEEIGEDDLDYVVFRK